MTVCGHLHDDQASGTGDAMALLTSSILSEVDNSLDALHGSDNSDWGTPRQAEGKYGPSLDERLDGIAAKLRKLVGRGKRDRVVELLSSWRERKPGPTISGTIPDVRAELEVMRDMVDRISAGKARLDDYPSEGSERDEIRYYTVKRALERRGRWDEILDEIQRRAGL